MADGDGEEGGADSISEWLPQHINQRGKGCLRQFMKHIGANGQTGVPYHAVSLRNAGETAEGQHHQHEKGMARTTAGNAAGDFQYTAVGVQKRVGQTGEGHEKDVQQIEEHHVTAQLRDAEKPGENGVVGRW